MAFNRKYFSFRGFSSNNKLIRYKVYGEISLDLKIYISAGILEGKKFSSLLDG